MSASLLIVDDDPDIVAMLEDRLEALGFQTSTAGDGLRAAELIERSPPDLVLLDLELPRLSGMDLLRKLVHPKRGERVDRAPHSSARPLDQDLLIIVMTAYGTIATAVEAMKLGAYDFITKPFDMDHLSIVLQKALERETLKRQVAYLRTEVETRYAAIIGESPRIAPVIEAAHRAADSNVGVLLLGESGTGKELFARTLHQWSPRRSMPFVVINCVALSDSLLENELFGHEKGAFTGADRTEKGKIEAADGGTLFLDEIGDMPLGLQAKLLRVLQDREFHRVGGTRTVKVNIRVIAATNKDLKQAVKLSEFREDLFYRLNIVTLTLPPLRERPEDLPLLIEFFLKRYARELKRPHLHLTSPAMDALHGYAWPGNIRELENAIARAAVLSPEDAISAGVLALSPPDSPAGGDDGPGNEDPDLPYHESMEQHSRTVILRALKQANGNQTKAAAHLRLQRTYLARLIRQKGLASNTSRA